MFCLFYLIFLCNWKKYDFNFNFNPFKCLNNTSGQKGPFLQKKDWCSLHLSYVPLVTYVPPLGAEQFQFPCRVCFNRFLAEDEQKPKLVSAHPQNSQTVNQKKSCCWTDQYFSTEYFCLFDKIMATLLKATRW